MRVHQCVIAACLALLASAAGAQDTLRLGTWNLEQLGFREQPRTAADHREMARVIRELPVDVLAVQEVGGPEPLGVLCSALGPAYEFVLGTTGGFGDDSGRISVGFVWNRDRVELLQAEELLDLPRESQGLPIFHRVPVSAVFRSRRGGLDFRAVVVHLKASRGTTNERKRVAEVAALAGYLKALAAAPEEDRDVVVLGDFNHTYGAPAHAEFLRHDVVTYVRPAQLRPTILHFPEPIDHVAIGPGLAEELVDGSFTVHGDRAAADPDAWRKACSDHIPVTVQLRDDQDRDPDARFRLANAAHRLAISGGGTADGPEPASPFAVGTAVVVVHEPDHQQSSGVLLAPLGDWVILELPDRSQFAIPASRVASVHARPN